MTQPVPKCDFHGEVDVTLHFVTHLNVKLLSCVQAM